MNKNISVKTLIKNYKKTQNKNNFIVPQLNKIIRERGIKGASKLNKTNKINVINDSFLTKAQLNRKYNVNNKKTKKDIIKKISSENKKTQKPFIRSEKKPKRKSKKQLIQEREEAELRNNYINKLETELYNLSNSEDEEEITINLRLITLKKAVELIKDNLITNKKIVVGLGDNYYTMSYNFISKIENYYNNKNLNVEGSDIEIVQNIRIYNIMTVQLVDEIKETKPDGAFFKYYNLTCFNLSKYGIFKKEDINKDTYKNNCLFIALENGGMNNIKLNNLKSFVNNRNIPICKLKEITEKLDITINLKRIRKDGNKKTRNFTYGNNKKEIYNIGLIDEHYFIIDNTNITSYCLKNYNDVKHIKDFNKMYKKNYKSNKNFIDSFNVIDLLIKHKKDLLKLIPSADLEKTQYINDDYNFDSLEYPNENIRTVENKKNERYNDYYKIFFDFETWTDKKDNNKHKPYLVCYTTEDNITKYFYGDNCGYKMLFDISNYKKKVMLIAHNAKYDYLFISKYLSLERPLIKDGNFYASDARFYYGKKDYYDITVKDSYKLISMPLKDFGKCFNLEQAKELMPYDLYNIKDPLKNKYRKLSECLKYLKNEDEHKIFINNCIKFNCIDNKNINNKSNYDNYMVDIIKYSKAYCQIDCIVLKNGYETFKKWMSEITKLNIDNILTIASLAHKYMISQNVYEDVKELSGIPRAFIQMCVVGGRVMTKENIKQSFNPSNNEKMADYDACSLYPSAMHRLGLIGGYLKGKPKILNNNQLNMDFLNGVDGYFIKIKINNVGKNYNFPLLSYKNDNKIRHFTNDLNDRYIYVDKISLEDAMNFQKIDFDIIQGYYYNEGRNNKIKEVINYLYNERKIKKADKNPIESCYKLIMNSAYGKTILKPSMIESKILYSKNSYDKFINFNYNLIREMTKISDNKYLVELYKPINNQFNIAHVGVEVLSMSKRIMNEVICLAEDNNIQIYYQDTDSMHINYSEVEKLEKLFYNKYNRALNGKEMGQFHIDFKLKGSDAEIYAKRSLFLGKKCYIDELECINKDGKIINGYHIRMKGISTQSILYKCEELKISPFELYEKLYKGDKITFDLTAGGNKCCFEFMKLNKVSTKSDFYREISF